MSSRRLSQRQKARIRQAQDMRRRSLPAGDEGSAPSEEPAPSRGGRVVTRHGAHLAVEEDSGALVHCRCRQNLGPVVCGDRVVWQATEEGAGVVTAVLERTSVLARPDYSGREKPLAANLTALVLVVAPSPPPSEYLVDQYLVAAESIGLEALIAVNKADTLNPGDRSELLARFAVHEAIGYPVVSVSARTREGLDMLRPRLRDGTSILVGQSGVGKSSLIQALLPDLQVQVGRLSEATGLGRHTTSAATLYNLPSGGALIDSPGVRSFRLPDLDADALARGFRELRPYLGRCRYKNCTHGPEPDCALKEAVARGLVDRRRMESFRHMLAASLDRR